MIWGDICGVFLIGFCGARFLGGICVLILNLDFESVDFGFVAMFLLTYFCGSHIFVENLLESKKILNQKNAKSNPHR